MRELLLNYLPEILAVLFGIFTAVAAFVVSFVNIKKKKLELEEVKLQAAKDKAQLEADKVHLEKMMLEGAFIICPNCDTKIMAKDMVFYTKEVEK